MPLFPKWGVRRVLTWWHEARTVEGTPQALDPQPREYEANPKAEELRLTRLRLISVGQCLDRLRFRHREAIDKAFTLPDDHPALRTKAHEYAIEGAMKRLGRLFRRGGVI